MKLLKEAIINANSRVFLRADLDVPLENGKISDTYRLEKSLPTIKYLLEKGAHVVIAGHLGRPKGMIDPALSTQLVRPFYEQNLGQGKYDILENLRFDAREEKGDVEYANEILNGCNIYVNDSFATSHRKHTSMVEVPKLIPAYAGLRLEEEVANIRKVLEDPARPLTAIVGGAKIDSKMPVINKFLEICDNVLLGGKLGQEWKESVPNNLQLPTDYAEEQKDIGNATIKKYSDIILQSKTVIWSGPMGMFEDPQFQRGTVELANLVVISGAFSLLGGGDTVSAITKFGFRDKFNFVSTGGSAMLELLVKGTLPALESLK